MREIKTIWEIHEKKNIREIEEKIRSINDKKYVKLKKYGK